jgi:ABC-type cobalamin/Fe3+-siderophores transport system ATPase subunit
MSPGKRGLVLLNLILHLSNSSHPILIDQPEDNLDNRTIYDQLNEFIRLRKGKRQIIMVTHNANLVVAADSECVIVANQAGQQANIENEEFKFEYCSGSLECSFENKAETGTLKSKGIRQHVCEILEGGVPAFKEREMKYGFTV